MFILGALALIIGKMGFLEGVSFWSIVFSIALLGILVDGIFNRSCGMILFSLAFLIIVNDKFLGLEEITPWPVLGAAYTSFGSIILYIPADWRVVTNVDISFGDAREHGSCNAEGSNTLYVYGDVSFGEIEIRYL